MSSQGAIQWSLYRQLELLPEGLTGEIINGQIHTQPRPAWARALAASSLGDELISPFQKGRGGPGGWRIISEPEVHLVLDCEVTVPDLAGWKKTRMPDPPEGHKIQVIPDWMCEILSPSSRSKDREIKMPLYAVYGVPYAWLIDPKDKTLEAFKLKDGKYFPIGALRNDDTVSVEPFDAIRFRLSDLWG